MSLHPQLAAVAEQITTMSAQDRPALNKAITGWARVCAEPKRAASARLLAAVCEQAGRAALAGNDVAPYFTDAASALGYPSPDAESAPTKPKRRRSSVGGRWGHD